MKERFQGNGHQNLVDARKRQEFVGGDAKLAEAFAARGELLEFAKGSQLISAPEIRDWAARLEAGWPSAFRAACPHSAVRSATDNRGLG